MSLSFPSSSGWEPYGSSQQAHALGWRRPATRPTPPLPSQSLPSSRPSATPPLSAAARWNQHHNALSRRDSAQQHREPAPPANAVAASFHTHERETRVIARYEAVRAEIQTVATRVAKLAERVDNGVDLAEKRDDQLARELARVQGLCSSLREDIRERERTRDEREDKDREDRRKRRVQENAWREEQARRVEKIVQRAVEKRVTDMVTRLEGRIMDGVETVVKDRCEEIKTLLRDVVKEIVKVSPASDEKRDEESVPADVVATGARNAGQLRGEPARPQTRESDDLYALQVANRPRPTAVQDFSDPYEREDSLNLLESHDGNKLQRREQLAAASYPASNGTNFLDEEHELSRSEATVGNLSKEPNFRLPHSPSESDSLNLGSFSRKPKRPRNAQSSRKGQADKKSLRDRKTRSTLRAQSNLNDFPITNAPITRSRTSVGAKRRQYPA